MNCGPIRATHRCHGFCDGWSQFVKLGLTANTYQVIGLKNMTFRQWVASFLPKDSDNLEDALADFLNIERGGQLHEQLLWTKILSERPILRINETPAEILLDLLLNKLKFNQDDKDMLVFYERLEYKINGDLYEPVLIELAEWGVAYTAFDNNIEFSQFD